MPVTWLYVPGDRPDRFAKAATSGADVVIVDLEDAVAPPAKANARRSVARWLDTVPAVAVEVRLNAPDSPWWAEDLSWAAELSGRRALRLPKIENPAQVADAVDRLGSSPSAGPADLVCLIESALGVERAFEIASAPGVDAIGLGEADLAGDLGLSDPDGLAWARSRIVIAARAAGLPAPAMSVYAHIADLDGLARSCRAGRASGFHGRAAVHPSQVPVIAAAFRPTAEELVAARSVLDVYDAALERGAGATRTPDGRLVDAAMISRARSIVRAAECDRGE